MLPKKLFLDYQDNNFDLDELSCEDFGDYLYQQDLKNIELLIRTGGEKRLSNFLLWQAAYAELYFTDKYWPDFGEADFDLALKDFKKRERRFGGLNDGDKNA